MRRIYRPGTSIRQREWTPEIAYNFDRDLLANYASCILTWNRVENAINVATSIAIGCPPLMRLEIISRINGLDAKKDLIYAGMRKNLKLPESDTNVLKNSVGFVCSYKSYRDAIAHAYVYDSEEASATTSQRRGRMDEILLTKESLSILYEHLDFSYSEIRQATSILYKISHAQRCAPNARKGSQEAIQDDLSRLQERQSERKCLRPLQTFPD